MQSSTATSVTFKYRNASGKRFVFGVPELNDTISTATFKRKGDRVTLSLKKQSEFSWYDLAKKK